MTFTPVPEPSSLAMGLIGVALALLAVPVIVIGFLLFKPRSLAPLRESDVD